ncbi:MAG TPA: thermonuclease family protein, partial [Thermomicrobiales bacterium]|nr:thermonuclease family protein [Thermomicrobiales bacterium]
PVPSSISRAARKQGTRADGFTVADDIDTIPPVPIHAPARTRGHTIVAWTLRAAIMLVLVSTIGYFGRERLAVSMDDIRDRIPVDVQQSLGIANTDEPDELAINTAPEGPDAENTGSDGTNGASTAGQPIAEPTLAPPDAPVETEVAQSETDEVVAEQEDLTANIGGATTELPPTSDAANETDDPTDPLAPTETTIPPTEQPTPTEIPVEPTAVPTGILVQVAVVPTEIPTDVPTVAPTEEPTPEPTAVPTEVPTVEPTSIPTEAPTPEPTTAPTVAPTIAPTEEPTPEPTAVPTEEPTEIPTEAPTAAPAEIPTEAPTATAAVDPTADLQPTIESQEPSVLPETTPEQAVVSNGFRYTIEGASVGPTIRELPEINSVGGYGEWVVLSVYGQNLSDEAQVFDMANFRLIADGQEVQVDVGNAWVSGLAGNTPAYGNTDAIQWAPGEAHRFTLTFLAPPAAESLVLQAGDQTIDLSPALDNPTSLLGDDQTPVASDLLQGTVVEVIDGETIVVEIDGVQQTVRYLGVDAPTGDACYAEDAADANGSLVAGQTVTIERQATDTDARGNWVRDVWVTNDAGQPVLVSQQLVLAGAAEADISDPNTRFEGWLQQSQEAAKDADAGIWGTCGE